MKKRVSNNLFLTAACFSVLILFGGCSTEYVKSTDSNLNGKAGVLSEHGKFRPGGDEATGEGQGSAEKDSPPVGTGAVGPAQENGAGGESIFNASALSTIYFNYDAYTLEKNEKGKLLDNANFLSEHKQTKIMIAGHCDERGATDYNLALGERRARSAFEYLTDLGISPNRLTPVSFGEERPADSGHNEEAWALNRRAEFLQLK